MAADSDQSETTYQLRTVGLSGYAGKTVASTAIVEGPQTPAGDMFMFFGDIAITSADGNVATIYNNGQTSLGYSGTSGVTVEGTASGVLLISVQAFAQFNASVQGDVQDTSGAEIANAAVWSTPTRR